NIAKNLRRANADVVALQEVGSNELLDRLLTKELADLGYAAPVVGTEDKRGIRNVIASKLPIQWSQVHAPKTLPFPKFANDDPDSLPVRIVRGFGEPSSGILRATSELVPQDRRFSSFHGGAPCLIDHVLVSERLFRAVREAAFYNESLRYHGPYAGNEGLTPDSDHALALVAFEGA